MAYYPGGWNDLKNSEPDPITEVVTYAAITVGGTTTNGIVKYTSDFITPIGGIWDTSPISITSEPYVDALDAAIYPHEAELASALNMQTKIYNPDVPSPMENLLFLYGNDEQPLYRMNIPLSFGASTCNKLMISVFENAGTLGNNHGQIQVIDFGSGPFSGNLTLKLVFTGYYGSCNIGVFTEETDPHSASSILCLRCIISQIESDLEDSEEIKDKYSDEILATKKQKKKPKPKPWNEGIGVSTSGGDPGTSDSSSGFTKPK
ncbi:MAG: hypothetical protein HW421_82 [Ignavibacteria bacterium]|nr:hypothetical protein [Ignavibacteria bacterium]